MYHPSLPGKMVTWSEHAVCGDTTIPYCTAAVTGKSGYSRIGFGNYDNGLFFPSYSSGVFGARISAQQMNQYNDDPTLTQAPNCPAAGGKLCFSECRFVIRMVYWSTLKVRVRIRVRIRIRVRMRPSQCFYF